MKIGIVVADFYPTIAEGLLKSAIDVLEGGGHRHEVYRVSGALEIPWALSQRADYFDAMVALGCVIRGQTYHFEVVSLTCANGILQVQLTSKKPVGNGVLTVDSMSQAEARLSKGSVATYAVLRLLTMTCFNKSSS